MQIKLKKTCYVVLLKMQFFLQCEIKLCNFQHFLIKLCEKAIVKLLLIKKNKTINKKTSSQCYSHI